MSQNNLTLCRANYFETCWCHVNSSELVKCSYLLRHATSFSNSSYFCVYHTIRKAIECFNSSYVFPNSPVSNFYIYMTLLLCIIGFIGNGISIIILLCSKLNRFNVYKNLTIFCFLNILYLISILIRHINIYQQDLRDTSTELCRLHRFTVTFIGHLCSWQLVSTSIQRLHALLSLKPHPTTSWIQTWSIFLICIVIPLFIFDAQILFNYGLFEKTHICNQILNNNTKQFQHALKYPINITKLSNNISLKYHTSWIQTRPIQVDKKNICTLWNIVDTFLYAILPFIMTLVCSLLIIIKVFQRRRSTRSFGGIHHIQKGSNSWPDHLSVILITINILFLIMTGPSNICLIIQSIYKCTSTNSSSLIKISLILNEYLRLLQNSYHALSFIFYCFIGNKFRNSAKSICRTIYCKAIDFGIPDACSQKPLISCCIDRRYSSSTGQTTSSNSRPTGSRRLTIEQGTNNTLPLNVITRPTYVTFNVREKRIRYFITAI
ncbi:unnamed protein product [Rotaria sordida]|uniref:G-protein coupled receptors family 1 profile domain-containing protein n=1 Tax=Rotaria sordida TaxID=392033 RepID=A0A815AWG1_9BILA|nr:unnamed protein product [Rotaria sordida]